MFAKQTRKLKEIERNSVRVCESKKEKCLLKLHTRNIN